MEVVNAIISVTKGIYTIAKEVKANKRQCEQLVKRIQKIETSVKTTATPTTVPESREDSKVQALESLFSVLEHCKAEIHQYTDAKRWAKKVFCQLTCRDNFAGLHEDLDRCLNDLHTAFVIGFRDQLVEQKGLLAEQQNRLVEQKGLLVKQEDRMAAMQQDLQVLVENQKLIVQHYLESVPVGSINPQQAEESFSKRLKKEQSIVTAFLQNQGMATVDEFSDSLIPPADVTLGEEIGKGGFGVVYVGEWSSLKVGIKKLFCRDQDLTPKARKTFKNEARLLLYANHPNVVKFYGIVKDGMEYMLVMEYFENKCLRTVINYNFDSMTWKKKADYALEIALGLAYLHRQGVIHCDLKCNNILVRDDDTIAIADFGLAKVKQETRNSLSKVISSDATAGTTAWMAPELFGPGSKPSFASDVYAFGMILFELADGGYPFSDVPQQTIPLRVERGERPEVPSDTPTLMATIIEQCWAGKPSERPRCDELVIALKSDNDSILRLSANQVKLKNSTGQRTNSPDSGYETKPEARSGDETKQDSQSGYETKQEPQIAKPTPPPKPEPPRDPLKEYWDALTTNNAGALKSILSTGLVQADVSRKGLTGLQVACKRNYSDIVKVLLHFGADHQQKDAEGKLPIQLSTSVDVWRALAAKIPVPQGDLFEVAKSGDDVSARLILAVQKDPKASLNELREVESKGWGIRTLTPLHAAAWCGHLLVCEVFLQAGAEVDGRDKEENTPLMWAAWQGHLNVAQVLVERGADVHARDEDGNTPLHWAAWDGHVDMARFLLDRGADVNCRDKGEKTPLMTAAWQGHLDVAQLLVERGADVHARDEDGRTPLHWAAIRGHVDMARFLLDRGADVNCRDKGEKTPFMRAAWQGHLDVAQVLVERGADVHARDENGWTPLHWAAFNGRVDMARFLLDRGADVDCRNKGEKTPFMTAAYWGHLDVAQLLVERGADVHARDKYGWTARDWALQRDRKDVAEFLALKESAAARTLPAKQPPPVTKKPLLLSLFRR
ncbi:hypothetical protein HDU96_009597 [Phlyctochytrium bullatum]|nr:hypothetical protein HDU96_009597 [Phlyctochytrium bullatum]